MATTFTQSLVVELFDAIEAQQFELALSYLAADFKYSSATPLPFDSWRWLRMHRALAKAMPDLTMNFAATGENYGVVTGSIQLCGTHTGTLEPLLPAIPHLPATGHRVSLPCERVDVAVADGKVTALKVEHLPDGGLHGILAQLGVAPLHQAGSN